MKQIKYRPLATGDLHDIWEFSEKKWSRLQAGAYLVDLLDEIDKLSANPKRGRTVAHAPIGLRCFRFQSHNVYFLELDDSIEVRRILHVRMNAAAQLRRQ